MTIFFLNQAVENTSVYSLQVFVFVFKTIPFGFKASAFIYHTSD